MSEIAYMLNGQRVTEEEFNASPSKLDLSEGAAPNAPSTSGWPKTSLSLGVHPSQIPAAMEEAKRCGVPTDFDKRGQPIFTSQRHQNEYGRLYGKVDINPHNKTPRMERD